MAAPAEATLYDLVRDASPLVSAMVVASVLVLTVALERAWTLLRARRSLSQLDGGVMEAARRGDLEEARRLCDRVGSPWGAVMAQGLDRALGRAKGPADGAMRRAQRRALGSLRSWVWMLGSAGAVMPFVGLLGTVVGVMQSFQSIATQGTGGFAVVSGGISEALIATAVGLFVALEAVISFNIFQNIIAGIGRDLGILVDELSELLAGSAK